MFFGKRNLLTKDEIAYVKQQFSKNQANKEASAKAGKLCDSLQQEYYAANLQNFYNTTLEKDKSVLTLSSAAIGLLSTGTFFEASIGLWLISVISFGFAIICSLFTFICDASYMVSLNTDIMNGKNDSHELQRCKLKILGFLSGLAFSIGIVFLLLIAYYRHGVEK